MDEIKNITIEDLKKMLKLHQKELKLIEKMSSKQFEIFKKNFMLGILDPEITREEAIFMLRQMIATNLNIQRAKKGEKK